MEGEWKRNLPVIIFYCLGTYVVFVFIRGNGLDIYTIVFLGIFYYILISSYVTPYRMVINEEYIEAKLILKKDTHIPMRDIIKIRLENHSYQVLKNYTLFVHTCNKEYRFPTHLFNCKELNVYLADLCQEKGIEYYFKK